MRWRHAVPAAALVAVIVAAIGAVLVHILLGLFELKLAIEQIREQVQNLE